MNARLRSAYWALPARRGSRLREKSGRSIRFGPEFSRILRHTLFGPGFSRIPLRGMRTRRAVRCGGFTVIELLVCMTIVGFLLALLLPAVVQSRAAARRLQCENNLRQLGLAMLASADAQRRFPASGWMGLDDQGKAAPFDSWVVPILPWLERSDLGHVWNRDQPLSAPENRRAAATHINLLCCPDDPSVTGVGDLSYVVNGGVGFSVRLGSVGDCPVNPAGQPLDLNGNHITCPQQPLADVPAPSDRQLFTMLGMFFMETWKSNDTVRHHTTDTVVDGLSQTFLLSENVRAGYDPAMPDRSGWASPDANRTSFYINSDICKSLQCAPGKVNYALANAPPRGINSALTEPEGSAPWPSSFHTGDGVHFAFADGHVRFIQRDMVGAVYAALFSPQGIKLEGTALRQIMVDDARMP